MIYGDIFRQRLTLKNEHAVADTIDYLEMQFKFTDDWDGLEKWAHFSKNSTVYDIPLTDDCIRKEDHLNLTAGEWSVYLHGNEFADGEVVERITTSAAVLRVFPTGSLDGEPFPEIPASETERILARLDKLEESGGGGGTGTVTSVAGVAPDETGNVPLKPEDIGAASMEEIDALKDAITTTTDSAELSIAAESLDTAALADGVLTFGKISGTYGAATISRTVEINIGVPANVEKYPHFIVPNGWQYPTFGWWLMKKTDGTFVTLNTTNGEYYKVSADLKTWTAVSGTVGIHAAESALRVTLENGTAVVYSDDNVMYTEGDIAEIGYCASGVKAAVLYDVTVTIFGMTDGGVLTEAEKQEIAEMAAGLVEVPDGGGIDVTGAAVGQTIVVKAVNDNGTPTEWEAVDFPTASGGAWENIAETITVSGGDEGVTGRYSITPQLNSNDNWTEAIIQCSIKTDSPTTTKHRINWTGSLHAYVSDLSISASAVVLRMHITNVGDHLYVNSYDSKNVHGSAKISNGNVPDVGFYLHWSTIAAGETITSDGVVYYR